jgi:hypothetical protein
MGNLFWARCYKYVAPNELGEDKIGLMLSFTVDPAEIFKNPNKTAHFTLKSNLVARFTSYIK